MLRIYLNKKLNRLEKQIVIDKNREMLPVGNMKWTGSKISAVEFGYSLHASPSINRGNTDIKEIMQFIEIFFKLLPGDIEPQENILKQRNELLEKEMQEKAMQMAIQSRQDKGENTPNPEDLTPEEILNAVRGVENDNLSSNISNIFRVTSVIDNLLWEPYNDATLGECVRINKFHRFSKYIFEDNASNHDLQITFELLLLQMAEAEIYARKNAPEKYKYEDIVILITEFRRIVSEFLANMVRRKGDQLPPFNKD